MTKLEKNLTKSLIIGHRLSLYTMLQVDKLTEKTNTQESEEVKEIEDALSHFDMLTFPLAVLVGEDNTKELLDMIFDVDIEEDTIVDFIENHSPVS